MSYTTSVLIVNDRSQVLARRDGRVPCLPSVTVESGRAGISLSRAVRDQLGLEVFCLVLPSTTEVSPQPLRLQSDQVVPAADFFWSDAADTQEDRDGGRITATLAKVSSGTDEFGGFVWYSSVLDWIRGEIGRIGYQLKTLEQWNGRAGGVLLRVVTSGPQFWFKAVSDFNAREFGIAKLLASRHPEHFPRVIASQPAWNALLLEHVDGVELYDCEDLATWKTVTKLLAETQMEWVCDEDRVLSTGAADLRAESLLQKIPAFLDHVNDAMVRQPKTPPNTLTRADLETLGDTLYHLCGEVAALPFANGLANADFSPHNTLLTQRGPVFIDWAEACVSLPLIAGEYLWNRMVVESPHRSVWRESLRAIYLSLWAAKYGTPSVERAAQVLPAFSILAVAMFYHERECSGPSAYDGYLRSLTRKLDQALTMSSSKGFTGQA